MQELLVLIEADNDVDFPWTWFKSPSCLGDNIPSPSWFPVTATFPLIRGVHTQVPPHTNVHAQHTHTCMLHTYTQMCIHSTHKNTCTYVCINTHAHIQPYICIHITRVHDLQGRYERGRQMHVGKARGCESILNDSKCMYEKALPSPLASFPHRVNSQL